jgi:predicted alpha-1,6-mannanase (GH76 family)
MAKAYGTTPCGGLWWSKDETYVNAIANELFLDIAAHLANRAGSRSSYYLRWAKKEWRWFQKSGMINSNNTINDGLDLDTCENNGGTVWSYNQGVVLGGLTELSRATNDDAYGNAPSSLVRDIC